MFSVIVATYNAHKYIIEQLNSIVNQTIKPDHIYIYDDGSSDNTLSIISAWNEKQIVPIEIRINEHNKGYTKNFLEALFEVDDDYVFFCDQDDVWKENKIELYNQLIQKKENDIPLLITSAYSITDENLNVTINKHCSAQPYEISEKKFIADCSFPGMTFCVNKELKNLAKGKYSESNVFYHDYFISLLALNYGKMICVNTSTVLYRQHSSNQLGSGGHGKKDISHWVKVLNQKEKEMLMVNSFSKNSKNYLPKLRFATKRKNWLEKKQLLKIVFSLVKYLYHYNLKSYLADIYYCLLGK